MFQLRNNSIAVVIAFAAGLCAHGAPDTTAGKKLYEARCALCHGIGGKGGQRGPALNRPKLNRAPDDAALAAVIKNGIAPDMPGLGFLAASDLESLTAYVRSLGNQEAAPVPGDPANGARIYASHKCADCHIIAGQGSGYGPELTLIGRQRDPESLRRAVVQPQAALPVSFMEVEAVTKSGDKIRGIRCNEDTFTIQIKDAAGLLHGLRKSDLADLRKLRGQTPMPSYERSLTPADLQDLVAYLASLRGPS